jgi:hypothetical protein
VLVAFRADEIAQQLLRDRMALVFEDFQREGNVVAGKRRAVVKADTGSHQELVGEPICGYPHRACSEPV